MSGAKDKRLVSLDAFRGFTIAAMILVNNPGDWGAIYHPLDHAEWNGWTFTDWIFPFFLFIGGVSMTFSLGRRAEAGDDKIDLLRQLAKRAAIIFAIGLALSLFPLFDFAHVRIPGVLQRIALCTLLAAPFVVYFDWRRQLAAIAVLFAVYSVLQLAVPVPDPDGHVAAGALEPGRDFGAYVDRTVFGSHVWAKAKVWDPEGLVSTLPAIGSQLLGVLAGRWIGTSHSRLRKTAGMVLAGLACLALGQLLHLFLMPINKSLWTPSYAVMMTGFALLVFGFFFFMMDAAPSERVRDGAQRFFKPFTIYGMNALFLFALSGVLGKILIYAKVSGRSLKSVVYAPLKALPIGALNTSLLFALCFNALMFTVAWAMWKKRWFVKV